MSDRRIKFSCTTDGYESYVVLDSDDPDVGEGLAEWMRWQLSYLKAHKPGDTVLVTR
jgi:hypothetical protein